MCWRRGEEDLDDIDAGRQLFRDFVEEWWTLDAEPRLATKTLRLYAGWRERYVLPRLGDHELRQLTPALIQRFQSELLRDGVSEVTVRKVLVFTQGILERAVEWGRIPANPVRSIRKPPVRRARAVRPLAPESVEALREHLLAKGRPRDATLVSVLAYAGLRPGEALALGWGDVQENTLLIDKSLVLGEMQSTKTGRTRTVRLLKPLATDLAEWKMISGRPSDDALVFPTRDGDAWGENQYRMWRRRVYQPATEALGIDSTRPYDLRHSFCSLLLAEGRNPLEVAAQLGHSPTMTLETYGHLIEELRDQPVQPAEELIRIARQDMYPVSRAD